MYKELLGEKNKESVGVGKFVTERPVQRWWFVENRRMKNWDEIVKKNAQCGSDLFTSNFILLKNGDFKQITKKITKKLYWLKMNECIYKTH